MGGFVCSKMSSHSKLPVPIVALASEGSSGLKCSIRFDVSKDWCLWTGGLSRINTCHKLLQLGKSPKTLTGLARTSWRQRHERVLLTSVPWRSLQPEVTQFFWINCNAVFGFLSKPSSIVEIRSFVIFILRNEKPRFQVSQGLTTARHRTWPTGKSSAPLLLWEWCALPSVIGPPPASRRDKRKGGRSIRTSFGTDPLPDGHALDAACSLGSVRRGWILSAGQHF